MKRFLLLLTDFKYFSLIMLMLLLVAVCFIPLKIINIFLKDNRLTKQFIKFFLLFD